MTKDVIALAPVWAYFDPSARSEELAADAFRQPGDTAGAKHISDDRRAIFSSVHDGRYDETLTALRNMSADAGQLLVPASAEKMKATIIEALVWAERGVAWKREGLLAPAYAQTPPGY